MGRWFVCNIVAAMFLIGALLLVTPADAQVSQDSMVCGGKVLAAQPDQRVAACTAVIEAGGEVPANMAVAYCNRGAALEATGQRGRAIADFEEAVRIAPKSAISYRCRGFAKLSRGAIDDANR